MKKIEITNPQADDWALRLGVANPDELILRRLDNRLPELIAQAVCSEDKDVEILVEYCSEKAENEVEFVVLLLHCINAANTTAQHPLMGFAAVRLYQKIKSGVDLTGARADFDAHREKQLAEIEQKKAVAN